MESGRRVEWHQGELFARIGFIVTNLSFPAKGTVHFYNGRGTAQQWINEGKYALNWTRLSCHKFLANQVRLWLFVLASSLGNFVRRLALPEAIKHWSLTSPQTSGKYRLGNPRDHRPAALDSGRSGYFGLLVRDYLPEIRLFPAPEFGWL